MFDLDDFVARCQKALEGDQPEQAIEALVVEAIADPKALRAAFDTRSKGPSISDRAVHRSPTLTVLDVATPPGLRTPPHNHNMWAVIGVYDGEEQNVFFDDSNGTPVSCGERLLEAGEVAVLAPETIHAISNPLPRKSHAIHVYGGDLVNREGRSMWNPKTQVREDYEIDKLSEYVREMTTSA